MSVSEKLDFDLENLPIDVFDLVDSGLTVESLTAGHGMPETGASCCCCSPVAPCCSCCAVSASQPLDDDA